jgi:hypothetical protein
MAVDSGLDAQGTQFRISDDDITYISLGDIKSWDWSKPSKAEIDTTTLTDTAKSFRFGLKDNGTISVETFYDRSAGIVMAEASYDANTPYYFEVEYSDNAGASGTIKAFQGYVISMSETGSVDDVVNATIEIRLSGDITESAPSAV